MLQRLERRQAEGFRDGRHDVDIRPRVEAIELGRGQEAREEESLAEAARRHVLLHCAHVVAGAGDDEPDIGAFGGHARGGLDEIVGPLLPGDPSREEHERIAAFRVPMGGRLPGVDRVVHHAQALGRDPVPARDELGRVSRDRHDAVGRGQAQPLDRGHEAVLPAARAVEFRRVHVQDEGLTARAAGLDAREKREPVVGVDHVEGLARGDPRGSRGIAKHFAGEVGPVVAAEPLPRSRSLPAFVFVEGRRHVGTERGRDPPHAQGGPAAAATSEGRTFAIGSRDDPEILDRRCDRAARENERDLGIELEQAAHETLAGHAEPAADRGRELPAEHEHAHGTDPHSSASRCV